MSKKLRVAIIGAGPAGIYAGNILATKYPEVDIDLFDSLPAPYGLIRYGVAPDHPRIKGIVNSLHEMLDGGQVRFYGNVEFGKDLKLGDIKEHYHAVIFATGAIKDAELNIPGVELEGSYGAADFVAWYDGHPDYPRTWPLNAQQVAVLGNGNVALDVARVLGKHADDMLSTDIPANVYAGLKESPVTDVHVFGRRGPAQIKFTPIELRELGEIEDVDIVLYDEDFPDGWFNEEAEGITNQHKVMARIIQSWRDEQVERSAAVADGTATAASRRLHLHFFSSPVEITGATKVESIKFERTELNEDGASVHGTGQFVEYPVQAVYRAIGYFGSELPEVPFNEKYGVIRNEGGRVINTDGTQVPGLYATGWIKRGPVGLIGHTKSDATETIDNLLADLIALENSGNLSDPATADSATLLKTLAERGVKYTDWAGWQKLNAHEIALGAADTSHVERERVKVVDRDEQVSISRNK
jgi:ferredoxin--NADP+ reductase